MPRPLSGEHELVSHMFSFPWLSFLLPFRPYLVRGWIKQLCSQSSKSVVHTPPELLKAKNLTLKLLCYSYCETAYA